MTATTIPRDSLAPIEPHILYPLPVARERLGWGLHAMRAARRAGLKVKYAAGRGYVLGRDIIEHIDQCGKDSK